MRKLVIYLSNPFDRINSNQDKKKKKDPQWVSFFFCLSYFYQFENITAFLCISIHCKIKSNSY